MDRMPTTSTDFTLHLPSMDSDLMPEWLYEPGDGIPLTQEDIRRLYRNSTCTDDSISSGIRSLRAPSPAELQSLWDDSDSDSGSDDDDDNDENVCVSDADTDSTSATLHEVQIPSSSRSRSPSPSPAPNEPPPSQSSPPTSPPPPSPRRLSDESLRLYTYSCADSELTTCLESCIDETLLCNPTSVFADTCYVAAVKRESQNGVSRGSPELERVTEEDEEEDAESEESEDEPELISPTHTGTIPNWTSGVFIGNGPSEALSALALPPSYQVSMETKPRCFSPEPAAAAEVAYLFLRTQYSTDPKDSVGAFPTPAISRESSTRHSVKDLLRGFSLGRRDRIVIQTSA